MAVKHTIGNQIYSNLRFRPVRSICQAKWYKGISFHSEVLYHNHPVYKQDAFQGDSRGLQQIRTSDDHESSATGRRIALISECACLASSIFCF